MHTIKTLSAIHQQVSNLNDNKERLWRKTRRRSDFFNI